MKSLLAAAFVLSFFANPVLAADVSTVVDFTPMLDSALTAVGTLLALLLTALVTRILKGVGIQMDIQTQSIVDKGIRRAIDYGFDQVSERYSETVSEVEIKNDTVHSAVTYFMERWPDTVKRLKLTEEDIEKIVRSRFADHFAESFHEEEPKVPEVKG